MVDDTAAGTKQPAKRCSVQPAPVRGVSQHEEDLHEHHDPSHYCTCCSADRRRRLLRPWTLVRPVTIQAPRDLIGSLPGVVKDYALEGMLGLLLVGGGAFWILAVLL